MNNLLIYQAFECATVIFEIFIVNQYIASYFEAKKTKDKKHIGYILFFIGLVILSLFYREPLLLLAYTCVGIFLLELLFYKTTKTARIFSTLFFLIVMLSSEVICSGVIVVLSNVELKDTHDFGMPRILSIVVAKIIQILIVKIIGAFIQWRKDKTDDIELKRVVALFICQVFTILLAHQVFMMGNQVYGYFHPAVFFSMLGLLYFNMIIFWYFDNIKKAFKYKSQNEVAELKIEIQKQYYEMIEEYHLETNAMWHDMEKHMNMAKSLIRDGLIEDSEKYIHELDEQMESIPNIIKTSHPIISALLTENLRKARKENIVMNFDIKLLSEINISPVDLCVLLDNTIGNAIEACSCMASDKKRYIEIKLVHNGNALLFDISNPFNPAEEKEKRPGKHGYGIRNVRKVVDKYGGELRIDPKEGIYQLSIIIP